jgi:nucleotide-binding universal stress UspA family protein
MFHDLMVPITGTAGDSHALTTAIALSSSLGAHLAVVDLVRLPLPYPSPWGIDPTDVFAQVYEELRQLGQASAARLRERLQKESISWEVRSAESLLIEPPQMMALHARYADLTVMAAPRQPGGDASKSLECASALLFESGRPLLTTPPNSRYEWPLQRAVVAWQPTREAARALHDALPLLARAATVDVVTVDPQVTEGKHGEDPGIDIATHLARHGLQVNTIALPDEGHSVATMLLRHATGVGAQLLVAGGYGHSRLREWMFGGTTRELLLGSPIPVLFSH